MDLLTNIVATFFRPRLTKMAAFAQNADVIQQKQLKYLLSTASHTEWGKKYDFRSIEGYATFRQRIPVHSYDQLKPDIERMINGEKNILWPSQVRWYAQSSGTTNDKSKYIPVTKDILKKCHYQGGFDSVAVHLRNVPESRFFSKKGFILGGSHSPSPLNKNAYCGDLSAVLLQNLNPLVDYIRVPSRKIILMDEWERKIQEIVAHTWREDVVSISGVPSWMLVLIKALIQHAGCSHLSELWPNLEVFFHGGISFEPYRDQYKALIPSEKMHYVETYNASEGFFGLQDDPSDRSMLLMIDYGVFFEFIPLAEVDKADPVTLPLEAVEVGKHYAMLISTPGGLWRYRIGDTVRFTSLFPHKFVLTGRTKSYINAFGEELMVDNADKALAAVCRKTGAKIKEYTVAPCFLLNEAHGYHQWLVEFETPPERTDVFATLLDAELQHLNSDYEAKRYKNISLLPLQLVVAGKGLFYEWLHAKGKMGGQHKVPRLSNERVYMDELLQLNKKHSI